MEEKLLIAHISSMIVLLSLYAVFLEKGVGRNNATFRNAFSRTVGVFPLMTLGLVFFYYYQEKGVLIDGGLVVAIGCTSFAVNLKAVLDRLHAKQSQIS